MISPVNARVENARLTDSSSFYTLRATSDTIVVGLADRRQQRAA